MQKKRINLRRVILAVAFLTVTLVMPKTMGYADNTEAHMHGDVEYLDFTTNISTDINTGYYYLSDDYENSNTLFIDGDVHLCLNGHVMSMTATGVSFYINDEASLTIEDNNDGAGKIISNSSLMMFNVGNSSKLIINNGTFNCAAPIMFSSNQSEITIKGGSFNQVPIVGSDYGNMFQLMGTTLNIDSGNFHERMFGYFFYPTFGSIINLNGNISFEEKNQEVGDIYIASENIGRINIDKAAVINRPLILWNEDIVDSAIKISEITDQADLGDKLSYFEKGYTITKRADGFYIEGCSITKIPTVEKMSVEATPDCNITYQWGACKKEIKVITAADSQRYINNTLMENNYNEETQTFEGTEYPWSNSAMRKNDGYDMGYLQISHVDRCNILVEVQDEEVPENLDFVVDCCSSEVPLIPVKKIDDRTYIFLDLPMGESRINANASVNARFSLVDLDLEKEIAGETKSTYGFSELGSISCKVIWNKGLASEHSIVTYPIEIPKVKIDFDSQGGSEVASVEIVKDSKAKEPTAPVRDGYKFEGWYVDKECNTAFDFTTKLDKDITLYAKWTFVYKPSEEEIEENSEVISKKVVTKASTNGKLNIAFNDVKEANEYDILASYCGSNLKLEKNIKISTKNATVSTALETIRGSKIDKKRDIKFVIVAYKVVGGNRVEIGRSYIMHVAGKGSKYTNPSKFKSITKSLTIKKGKSKVITYKLAKENPKKKFLSKKHGNLVSFYSSDEKIAKVNKKTGKVKALKKGTCKIYAVTINGIKKTVKITVK